MRKQYKVFEPETEEIFELTIEENRVIKMVKIDNHKSSVKEGVTNK